VHYAAWYIELLSSRLLYIIEPTTVNLLGLSERALPHEQCLLCGGSKYMKAQAWSRWTV